MRDLLQLYAPNRDVLRAGRLNPWDLYLTDDMTPTEKAEQIIVDRYANMEHRYTLTPTRERAFEIMYRLGYNVIPHGRVGEVTFDQMVVYTNEYGGHAGHDKILVSRAEAERHWAGHLCSKFILRPWRPVTSVVGGMGRARNGRHTGESSCTFYSYALS